MSNVVWLLKKTKRKRQPVGLVAESGTLLFGNSSGIALSLCRGSCTATKRQNTPNIFFYVLHLSSALPSNRAKSSGFVGLVVAPTSSVARAIAHLFLDPKPHIACGQNSMQLPGLHDSEKIGRSPRTLLSRHALDPQASFSKVCSINTKQNQANLRASTTLEAFVARAFVDCNHRT